MVTTIIIAAALGIGAGVAGTLGMQGKFRRDDQQAAQVAAAAAQGAADAVGEAMQAQITEADTRQLVATMPAANIAMEAALKPDAKPTDVALAAYAVCVQGSQAQQQGAAAYGCPKMAEALVETIEGMAQLPEVE